MYAIIKTGGKQYKVKEGDIIDVEKLAIPESGREITINDVLLTADGDNVSIGQPLVKGATVASEIIDDNIKTKKITTYKYKRRKSYHRTIGHRQNLVRLRIKKISLG